MTRLFEEDVVIHEYEDREGCGDAKVLHAVLSFHATMRISRTLLRKARIPMLDRAKHDLVSDIHRNMFGQVIEELRELQRALYEVNPEDRMAMAAAIDRVGDLRRRLQLGISKE